MTLVEEYYELNEAEEVPVAWKLLQIFVYMCAGCLGLWCGYTMALVRIRLNDKCYLFASSKYNSEKDSVSSIEWKDEFWCDYCQYTMVSSFIVATIWATFFLMCGKGGKSLTGLPQPWRIVFCSLIFNIIYFSVSLSASIKINQGTEGFCMNTNKSLLKLRIDLSHCPPLSFIFSNNSNLKRMTVAQMETVEIVSWCCSLSWLILILISFFRIVFVVDFKLYKICVFQIDETTHNKKEEVLKITNYEEPKELHSASDEKMARFFEKSSEDLKKMKDKVEQEKKRKEFRSTQLKSKTAFYVTADIRMLDREKKRKKMKVLDEVFEKSQIQKDMKFTLPDQGSLTLNEPGMSQSSRFFYHYPNLIYESTRYSNDESSDKTRESKKMQSMIIARPEIEDDYSNSDDSIPEKQSAMSKKQV